MEVSHGKSENTRAGCKSRKANNRLRGRKGRGLAAKLSERACFHPFTTNHMCITLKHFSEQQVQICFPDKMVFSIQYNRRDLLKLDNPQDKYCFLSWLHRCGIETQTRCFAGIPCIWYGVSAGTLLNVKGYIYCHLISNWSQHKSTWAEWGGGEQLAATQLSV